MPDRDLLYRDCAHRSDVFGKERSYRVFLPLSYERDPLRRYPVIYWFHGHGGSYAQETYIRDFADYLRLPRDLMIVNVDGDNGDGTWWDYAYAFEDGTIEGNPVEPDLFHAKYFRELVEEVDSRFRTIADRDHRATSGQSRGGYMAPWVGSQNKDLVAIVSAFSPSPDAAMQGPADHRRKSHFPNAMLYRSLDGIPARYTCSRGDRYKQYFWEQKALWQTVGMDCRFHEADHHTHRATNIQAQFDWILDEFGRQHPQPENWNHADPYEDFTVWGYRVSATRAAAALTCLEHVTPRGLLIGGRMWVPDGPFDGEERLAVTTDAIYEPRSVCKLIDYRRCDGTFTSKEITSDNTGRLSLRFGGGGHAAGLSGDGEGAHLFLIPKDDRETVFCEVGQIVGLSFTLVNVGAEPTGLVVIRATTPEPFVELLRDEIHLPAIDPASKLEVKERITFSATKYDMPHPDADGWVGKIALEISYESVLQTESFLIYPTPESPVGTDEMDVLVLDGATRTFPSYNQEAHAVYDKTVTGGAGNGNGVLDPGEEAIVFLRLPKGLGEDDVHTWHPAYLLNPDAYAFIRHETRFIGREREANWSGAAGMQSLIKVDPSAATGTEVVFWFQVEVYEFRQERPGDDVIQRHAYEYRKVALTIGGESSETH